MHCLQCRKAITSCRGVGRTRYCGFNASETVYYTWHMLISKFEVDNVVSWFSGAVGDLACTILLILCVYINFAGAFN